VWLGGCSTILRRKIDDDRLEELMWACINNGGRK
jgi:hypothetical protein